MSDLNQQIVEWASSLGSLLKEEVPEFIRQVAIYGFYESITMSVFQFLAALLCALFIRWIYKNWDDLEQKDFDFPAAVLLIVSFVFIIITICFGFSNVSDAIKAKTAPKLYVIERFTVKK